jgi:glycogen debranching enzyme
VIEAPDPAAFLVVQLDVLAELAVELGRDGETDEWRREAEAMQGALLESWDGDVFVAKAPLCGRFSKTTSLLNTLAVVAASRLPDSIIETLFARTSARHGIWPGHTADRQCGYEADGYWRGPIWAPSTAIIEDGLRRAGQVGLATLISDRSAGGASVPVSPRISTR